MIKLFYLAEFEDASCSAENLEDIKAVVVCLGSAVDKDRNHSSSKGIGYVKDF